MQSAKSLVRQSNKLLVKDLKKDEHHEKSSVYIHFS